MRELIERLELSEKKSKGYLLKTVKPSKSDVKRQFYDFLDERGPWADYYVAASYKTDKKYPGEFMYWTLVLDIPEEDVEKMGGERDVVDSLEDEFPEHYSGVGQSFQRGTSVQVKKHKGKTRFLVQFEQGMDV